MKLILVASMAAVLAMGMSGNAEAHGYPSGAGGSVYWADDNIVIGFNYGGPYVRPYYVPPRGVYRPRSGYRHDYHEGRHYGHARGYKKSYRKAYSKGYRKGYRKGHRHDRRHDRHHDRRHDRHGHHRH